MTANQTRKGKIGKLETFKMERKEVIKTPNMKNMEMVELDVQGVRIEIFSFIHQNGFKSVNVSVMPHEINTEVKVFDSDTQGINFRREFHQLDTGENFQVCTIESVEKEVE